MAATESCRGTTSCPAVLLACITLVCSARLVACQEPAPESTANQQCFDIGYTTLARSGLSYGDYDEYGRLTDYSGLSIIRPVPADDNFTEVLPSEEVQRRQLWTSDARLTYFHSNNPDFPSVHEVSSHCWGSMVTCCHHICILVTTLQCVRVWVSAAAIPRSAISLRAHEGCTITLLGMLISDLRMRHQLVAGLG